MRSSRRAAARPESPRLPVLILHAGAGGRMTVPMKRRVRRKLSRILDLAYERLLAVGALEAVTFAVRLLEDDSLFNAGTGAVLQQDGRSRLSASVMDGKNLLFSAVINLEGYPNPVLIARELQSETSRVLAGRGAASFAAAKGFRRRDTRTAASIKRWKKRIRDGGDTVGACALDASGRLAAATSTGGRGMERPGRVSDSCMPIGNYASAECAVSATGHGEHIMSEGFAVRIAQRVMDGSPLPRAMSRTLRETSCRRHHIGAVAVDHKGRVSAGTTTPSLSYAWRKGRRRQFFS